MQFAAVKGIVNLNEMASFVYDINETYESHMNEHMKVLEE